jgi:hypothetical protein
MKPIFYSTEDLVALLTKDASNIENDYLRKIATVAKPRKSCYSRQYALVDKLPNNVLSSLHIWDKKANWNIYEPGEKKSGVLAMDVINRDPLQMGYQQFHLFRPSFSEPIETSDIAVLREAANLSGEVAGPTVRTAYAKEESPSMIMDPTYHLEIHTEVTPNYNLICVQGFNPADETARKASLEEGLAIFPGIKFVDQLERPALTRRNFDLEKVFNFYGALEREFGERAVAK